MIGRRDEDYVASTLETASSSDTAEDVLRREQRWKLKLGSREFGLNGN